MMWTPLTEAYMVYVQFAAAYAPDEAKVLIQQVRIMTYGHARLPL